MNLFFIFNLHAGKGLVKRNLPDIIDIFCKAGHGVTVYSTKCAGDAVSVVANLPEETYDRIICAGGDGTLDEVVAGNKQRNEQLPIGYIPAGSTNDFASSLGLPKKLTDAARIAIGDNLFKCDLGTFNSKSFVYIAAFGLFTDVSYETPQDIKNILGHAAYILEGLKRLQDVKTYKMKLTCNGKSIEREFMYGMVSNSVSVGGFKNITGKNIDLGDGLFEVTLISKPANPLEFNELVNALFNRDIHAKGLVTFKTSHIEIESDEEISWTLDGEFGGKCKMAVIDNVPNDISIAVKGETKKAVSKKKPAKKLTVKK